METEQQHLDGDTFAAVEQTVGHTKMSRRDALSIISKHAVYTAPAVLAGRSRGDQVKECARRHFVLTQILDPKAFPDSR